MTWQGYARALLFSNLLVGLVAFLIFRPQGIFGERVAEKA